MGERGDQVETRQSISDGDEKGGHKTHAAQALGIDRRMLYRLLEKHQRQEETKVASNNEARPE